MGYVTAVVAGACIGCLIMGLLQAARRGELWVRAINETEGD